MASEECRELKNLKYKTMLLSGNKKSFSSVIKDVENLDFLLDEETEQNKKETWNKLDKSIKMNKINEFIKCLTETHTLSEDEIIKLRDFFSINLDKKNLYKNKDVVYKKDTGILESIPNLHFNISTRKFSLKKIQVNGSTSKALGPTRKIKCNKTPRKSPEAKKLLETKKTSKVKVAKI